MKLSVVIPVYNVAEYLSKCITSIVEQSYSDMEIILIDDGSTDGSLLICNEAATKDPRINVVSQKNAGVSVARNTGLKMATGDYITFVDSDDWLESDMYERMIEAAASQNFPDLLMCDFTIVFSASTRNISSALRRGYYRKREIIIEIFPTLTVTESFGRVPIVSACICLFKKEFIVKNKVQFDANLKFSEDYLFMAACILNMQSFYYLKGDFFYNYRQYDISRSKKYDARWWSNLVELNEKLKSLLANCSDFNFQKQLKLQLLHSVFLVSNSIFDNKDFTFIEKIKLHRTLFAEPQVVAAFKNLSLKNRSRFQLILLKLIRNQCVITYVSMRTIIRK